MASPDKLIGSQISLISHKDIRYEGILFSIDQEKSCVTLQAVKCHGTEDRIPAGGQAYSADDTEYDYIWLEAHDIKDLHAYDAPSTPATSSPAPKMAPALPQQPEQQQEGYASSYQQQQLQQPHQLAVAASTDSVKSSGTHDTSSKGKEEGGGERGGGGGSLFVIDCKNLPMEGGPELQEVMLRMGWVTREELDAGIPFGINGKALESAVLPPLDMDASGNLTMEDRMR